MRDADGSTFGFEESWWDCLDAAKDAFATERWQGVLMDCSKNELLALVHAYRAGETTMSRIAEYVGVPLNTATGIANRLERRGLVERWRSEQDKRVVEVRITEQGKAQVAEVIQNIVDLMADLFEGLDDDERRVLVGIAAKVPRLLARGGSSLRDGSAQGGGMRRIAIE